jgi:hypothetical protein
MEIVVTAIVALVIGVLAGSIAGFRFADYLNDRQKLKLLGVDTDSERAIRWLIALMVLCCDPLAIALTAAASARR